MSGMNPTSVLEAPVRRGVVPLSAVVVVSYTPRNTPLVLVRNLDSEILLPEVSYSDYPPSRIPDAIEELTGVLTYAKRAVGRCFSPHTHRPCDVVLCDPISKALTPISPEDPCWLEAPFLYGTRSLHWTYKVAIALSLSEFSGWELP